MMRDLILEPQYFPNIQYFTKFLKYDRVIIDDVGRFEKQTFRNRTAIAGANKVLRLSVPVKKGKSKQMINHVKIDNSFNWQKDHWVSIESAYNKSPYFLYYKDHFEAFFREGYDQLLDLDLTILKRILSILDIDREKVSLLSEVQDADQALDFRSKIHPKEKQRGEDPDFEIVEYMQVFSDRHGFIPNLSILDLLFNTGPESWMILEQSTQ